MNNFFENHLLCLKACKFELNGEEKTLKEHLEDWGKNFWKVEEDEDELSAIFAQRGYEEKGLGHIKRIISNVGELLEGYFGLLDDIQKSSSLGRGVDIEEFIKKLAPNLILFYLVAHLHDIGMRFAPIYEALKPLVDSGGDSALHIGEIIHDYHHYSSMIVLLELGHIEPKEDVTAEDLLSNTIYLKNLPAKEKVVSTVGTPTTLVELLLRLREILQQVFCIITGEKQTPDEEKFYEFFVLMGVLCLFHKKVNDDYIQSILQKYKDDGKETIEVFNTWWDYFQRAGKWTKKVLMEPPDFTDSIEWEGKEKYFPGSNQISCDYEIKYNGKERLEAPLDPHFVEALLQYGDKTEITIARLARSILPGQKDKGKPLHKFIDDLSYDNKKGFICTDMAQRKISPYARYRACRFIPVPLVEVKKSETEQSDDSKVHSLDVIIHYFRFKNDEQVFRMLRYFNEKDFYDLDFLDVIKVHLSVLLLDISPVKEMKRPFIDIVFRKQEHSSDTSRRIMRFFYLYSNYKTEEKKTDEEEKTELDSFGNTARNLIIKVLGFADTKAGYSKISKAMVEEDKKNINSRDRFPYTRQNQEAVIKFSWPIRDPEARKKNEGKKTTLFETGDMIIPTSFETLAVLNLFREEE